MRRSLLLSFAFLVGICHSGNAQDVVSASSGLLHYFEGRVDLDDKLVEHKAAVFPSLKNGSLIRTEKGRAELMLTPEAYLRMDEQTSLRMDSNSLTDTRLELLGGTVIVDNLDAATGTPVVLIHNGTSIRFPKPGIYRVDCEPGELQVFSGEAEVTHGKLDLKVDSTHLYYFALEMTINKYGDGAMDEFYDWAHNRSEVIADQKQMASAEQKDADEDASGIPGLSAPFASPQSSGPYSSIFGYPAYGGSSTYGSVISPLYLSPLTPHPGFLPSSGIFIVSPYRHRPIVTGGRTWPVSAGIGYRPIHPVVSRWPGTGQSGSFISSTPPRFPVSTSYHPPAGLPARPGVTTIPRLSIPSYSHPAPSYSHPAPSYSHPGVSHVGAAGHR